MSNVQNPQSGASTPPPIPPMGQAAPAPTNAQVRAQAAEIAKEARQAVRNSVRNEIAGTQGSQPTIATTGVPPFNPAEMIPPQAVEMVEAFFFTVAFCVVGFPIARALGRRLDRTKLAPGPAQDLRPQIQQLQQSMDAMAVEIERISENQRFTTKVLTERAGASK